MRQRSSWTRARPSSSASASSPRTSTTPATGACRRWNWPTEAARAALTDTGADARRCRQGRRRRRRPAAVRDLCAGLPAPLGKSNNYPRSVMQRLGAQPARSVVEPVGGQGPQKLVTEFGSAIAAGEADVVMIIGSEPGSTLRYFAKRDDKPDFTEHVDGQLEDRGHQIYQYVSEYTIKHGLTGAPVQYGLLDNARRGRLGLQRRRVPAADGRTVRAALENRCEEPVFVVARRTFRRGDRDGNR